ncbi:MAG: hypothetical protein ABI589_07150, partial [Burkholderiales bacterium]
DGSPLESVRVGVHVSERIIVPTIGPEGTIRPKREAAGSSTDRNGEFTIDIRGIKTKLKKLVPGKSIVMDSLILSKDGYATKAEPYKIPGQVIELTPK